jgi:hypothetical protein
VFSASQLRAENIPASGNMIGPNKYEAVGRETPGTNYSSLSTIRLCIIHFKSVL